MVILLLDILESLFSGVVLGARDRDFLLLLLQALLRLVESQQPQSDLKSALFFGQLQKLLRLLGLLFKRPDSLLELRDDIAQTQEVFLGVFELSLGVDFAVAVA